ncbi:MAG TPA: AMP-binding protein, partial [Candidatus Deferrimicrobium sp.]|nr:AMP-binding protein [Candidatus Deferrimicrobium sp.]
MMPNKKTPAQLSVLASQRVKEKEYWLRKLSDFPGKSRFPLAYNKKSPGESRLEATSFELSSELSSALIKLCNDSDVRLHIILVAGINALLHRYLDAYNYRQSEIDGQSDIVMGCPILRSEQEANFINLLLVLRTHVQSHMTFKELLLEVRQTVAEALENCNYPVEILAEQLNMPFLPGDEFPLFDIAVLLENIHDKKVLESVHPGMIFSFNREDLSIRGCVEYNPSQYDAADVEQISVHLQRLLQHASANPGESIFALELMQPGEKEQLLIAFNDTGTDYPTGKTIHELFAEQVEVSPDRIAVFSHERTRTYTDKNIPTAFTYRELNEQSDRLACLLNEKGVLADNIIGIMMGRSIDLVIGIMGILKAGGAYMPIDPEYPQERIDYMLADSGAGILINKSEIRNLKPEINSNGKNTNDQNKNFGDLIILDFEYLNFDIVSNFEFRASNSFSSNLAYIIYTSGSTGKPKGVMVEHRQVVNILFDLFKRFPFGENDTYLLKTPIVFDVSVSELFGWFMGGGRLAILENGAEKDPQKILDTIHRCRISHLNFV